MCIIRTCAKRVQTHGAPTAMDVPPGPRRRHHLSFWRICGRSLSVCSTPGRWMFGMRSAPGQKSPGRYMKGVGELTLKVDGRVLVAFQSNFVGKNEQEWSIVILGIWDPQSSLVPPSSPARKPVTWNGNRAQSPGGTSIFPSSYRPRGAVAQAATGVGGGLVMACGSTRLQKPNQNFRQAPWVSSNWNHHPSMAGHKKLSPYHHLFLLCWPFFADAGHFGSPSPTWKFWPLQRSLRRQGVMGQQCHHTIQIPSFDDIQSIS